jgi:hypothetical protein
MSSSESSDLIKSRNEWLAGTIGGFVCKVVEYPLDTIKVQVQTQTFVKGQKVDSPLSIFLRLIRKDGFLALYRGIPSPLLGSMVGHHAITTLCIVLPDSEPEDDLRTLIFHFNR